MCWLCRFVRFDIDEDDVLEGLFIKGLLNNMFVFLCIGEGRNGKFIFFFYWFIVLMGWCDLVFIYCVSYIFIDDEFYKIVILFGEIVFVKV